MSLYFLPEVKHLGIKGPYFVFVDNHAAHMNAEISKFCEDNDIYLIGLHPHATFCHQPLDVAVFACLKKKWYDIISNWPVPVTRSNICSLVGDLMKQANFSEAICAGFRSCGLVPFNPTAIDTSQLIKPLKEKCNARVYGPNLPLYAINVEEAITKELSETKKRSAEDDTMPNAELELQHTLEHFYEPRIHHQSTASETCDSETNKPKVGSTLPLHFCLAQDQTTMQLDEMRKNDFYNELLLNATEELELDLEGSSLAVNHFSEPSSDSNNFLRVDKQNNTSVTRFSEKQSTSGEGDSTESTIDSVEGLVSRQDSGLGVDNELLGDDNIQKFSFASRREFEFAAQKHSYDILKKILGPQLVRMFDTDTFEAQSMSDLLLLACYKRFKPPKTTSDVLVNKSRFTDATCAYASAAARAKLLQPSEAALKKVRDVQDLKKQRDAAKAEKEEKKRIEKKNKQEEKKRQQERKKLLLEEEKMLQQQKDPKRGTKRKNKKQDNVQRKKKKKNQENVPLSDEETIEDAQLSDDELYRLAFLPYEEYNL